MMAIIAVIVSPGANAVVDVEEPPKGGQTGQFANFPYCRCDHSQSAYRMESTVMAYGNGTYCFTLLVQPCNSTCCNVDLKKIEVGVTPKG